MSQFDITVEGGTSVRLPTAGKYCPKDILVTATGSSQPSENLDAALEEQAELISELSAILDEKASGGGGGEANWLFEDEFLETSPRSDLPSLKEGATYSLFYFGNLVDTVAVSGDSFVVFSNMDMGIQVAFDMLDKAWFVYSDPWVTVHGGYFSVRIDYDVSDDTGGDDTGGLAEWIVTETIDGVSGLFYISNGYLYANDLSWRVQDTDRNVIGYFDLFSPFDLSLLNASKNYEIWRYDVAEYYAATLKSEERWLFKDEYVSFERTDLPNPVKGRLYTCYLNGVELGAPQVYDGYELHFNNDASEWFIYSPATEWGDAQWYFHPVDSSIYEGIISVKESKKDPRYKVTFPVTGTSAVLRIELAEGVSVDNDWVTFDLWNDDGFVGSGDDYLPEGGYLEWDMQDIDSQMVASGYNYWVNVYFDINNDKIAYTTDKVYYY